MQGLLEAVNRYITAGGLRITVSKTKVMSSLTCHVQDNLINGKYSKQICRFSYLGSTYIANGQGRHDERPGALIGLWDVVV